MAHNSSERLSDLLEEKKRIQYAGKLHWFHWAIILASLVLTFGAWHFAQTQLKGKVKDQFDREAERVIELVVERMRKYEDALWSGTAAVYLQDDGINYNEWKRFSRTLKIETKYPGINGIGIIYHVMPDDLNSFLAAQRQLRPDFKIHPPHDEKEYFPITYIEPVASNKAAVGLDMAHETNRYEAAKKSRDTGLAQITGPITLVQDAEKTPGFLFYVPFYESEEITSINDRQKHFSGLVYAPFIFKKLIEGTLASEKRHVSLEITDAGTSLFNENRAGQQNYDPDPLYTTSKTINVYGRNWTFDIRSKLSFKEATHSSKPWMILVSGLIIEALLLGLFIVLARSNKRAVRFAEGMADEYETQATHLSNIIEHAVDGLITIDELGIIQSFNPACEKMFGYKQGEVIGKNIKILMPEPFHSAHDTYLSQYKKTKQKNIIGVGREVEGKTKDGDIFALELSVSEIKVQGQKLYSGIVRDITERKAAQEDLESSKIFQDLVLNTIPDFVFVKDEDSKIVQANEAFINNYPKDKRDKVIGYTTIEDYPPEQVEAFLANDREALSKGYNETYETITFPDGTQRVLFTKKTGFDSVGKRYLLGVSRDVTDMKKAEEEIMRSNEELERFAYVASHDLQEPLRMVTNFTQLLAKKHGDQLNDEAKEYLNFAYDGAFRMQELVGDLLEYARLGQEGGRYEDIDTAKTLETVKGNLKAAMEEYNASLEHGNLPTIHANPMLFSQLLQNLISNGLKYQNPDVEPKIYIDAHQNENEWVFSVKDNGIGMKQEYCQKIFEPFKRLHGKGEFSGTGMGLAICRKIVESFDGKIWAESSLGEGSIFYFTVPIKNKQSEKET